MLDSLLEVGEKLAEKFEELSDITPERIVECSKTKFEDIRTLTDNVKSNANVLYSRLEEEFERTGTKIKELKAEKENLEKAFTNSRKMPWI